MYGTSRPIYQSTNALREIRAAGVTSSVAETAKDALTWDTRPCTPPKVKQYQHYARQEPGTITKHFGAALDGLPDGPFGAKTKESGHTTADCIKCFPESEMGRWKLERSEDVYASTKREPLGKTYERGYKMPEALGTTLAFGKSLNVQGQETASSTKDIIFPAQNSAEEDPSATHKLYLTSHAAFEPGEQRKRDYNWSSAGINPVHHRFGAATKGACSDGVRKALQPDLDEEAQAAAPAVVSHLYEQHKLTAGDALGQPRLLGVGERKAPPGGIYGKPSGREPEPCVGELIKGWYTPEQQAPDADLGKSLREGFRNTAPAGRTFGLPSVRTDVPAPTNRSVANTHNYGNEPDAMVLLRPPKSVDLGVEEAHLLALRNRDQLLQLLQESGLDLTEGEFEQAFAMAADVDGQAADRQRCSLNTFMRARHYLLAQAS